MDEATAKDRLLLATLANVPFDGWSIAALRAGARAAGIAEAEAVMKNLIGRDVDRWRDYIGDPTAKLHLYGKTEARPGRKMGHVTRLIARR